MILLQFVMDYNDEFQLSLYKRQITGSTSRIHRMSLDSQVVKLEQQSWFGVHGGQNPILHHIVKPCRRG